MKKIVVVLLITLSIIACGTSPNGFVLNGEITGDLTDSTKVYLKITDSLNKKLIDIDTTTVVNGKFQFKGNQEIPTMHYLVIDGIRANLPVIIENGEIEYTGQKDSLQFARATGTPQNNFFVDYSTEQLRIQQMVQSMSTDLRAAQIAKDTTTMNSLREEYFDLQEKSNEFNVEFVKNNPTALISAFILETLLQTKALPAKEIKEIFDEFSKEVQESRPSKRLTEQLEKTLATAVGSTAPQFSGPTPDGKNLALNDVKGKLTLIDFWAAWCKPCRQENPNIVSVYNKYKDKGLNVVGVSLDRKSDDWINAISADGLAWNHISNLDYFDDPIAKLYGVNAIPAAFLLDENGVIIAKNLRGPELEKKVAEILLN